MDKKNLTVEQGVEAIMAILDGAKTIGEAKVGFTQIVKEAPEVVYEHGQAIVVDGKKVAKGYKKGAKRVKTPKDNLRADLLDGAEVVINRIAAFTGKTGRNSVEGVVIRLDDADYTIKCTGHAKAEYADREEGFVATKNFITRGKDVNHSSAIAKVLVSEIENRISECSFGIEKPFTLLAATASTIRFAVEDMEFSFKVTKKRSRICMN
ncbi:MAG: hypothetical protein RR128_08475 [Clostridium sp.]